LRDALVQVSLSETTKFIEEQYPILDNKPALMRAFKKTILIDVRPSFLSHSHVLTNTSRSMHKHKHKHKHTHLHAHSQRQMAYMPAWPHALQHASTRA